MNTLHTHIISYSIMTRVQIVKRWNDLPGNNRMIKVRYEHTKQVITCHASMNTVPKMLANSGRIFIHVWTGRWSFSWTRHKITGKKKTTPYHWPTNLHKSYTISLTLNHTQPWWKSLKMPILGNIPTKKWVQKVNAE